MFFFISTQFIVIGALSLVCLYFQGNVASQSVIFGGLTYCVPYVVTSLYLNKPGADTATKVLVKAYISTVYKFVIAGALFVYFFKYKETHFITFFFAYIVALIVQYVMLFGFKRN